MPSDRSPTSPLTFTVTFDGPVKVTSGHAGAGGVDSTVDRTIAVPATSLKGVIRDAADQLVGHASAGQALLDATFGSPRTPSAWAWSDLAVDEDLTTAPVPRTRVRLNDTTGTVVTGALLVAEEHWIRRGTVTLTALRPTTAPQRALLLLAAATVDALGSDRRRGSGWTSWACADEHTAELAAATSLLTRHLESTP